MIATLDEPVFAGLGAALLAVVSMALGFQVGKAVGTVQEFRDERRETEVLEEVVRVAEQLKEDA